MPSDSARVDGDWRIDRRLLAAAATVIGLAVLSVFPFRLLPAPWFADSVLHFASGVALTLGLAAIVPRRDDVLAVVVVALGILWEPAEWAWFMCDAGLESPSCTIAGLEEWMSSNDTIKDMALVAVGAFSALVGLGRYR